MQVTIFGGNGKVGRLVVANLLERDHTVVVFVHAHNTLSAHPNLRTAQGDVNNMTDVAKALEGSEVVVSTLSSWKSKRKDVLASAMRSIIPIMEQKGIKRLISLTGGDALDSKDRPGLLNRVSRFMLMVIAGGILRDGEEHLRLLRASKLDWTVVRSPVMTGSSDTTYRLQTELVKPYSSIPRQAVAKSITDLVENGEYVQAAPGICRV